MQTLESLLAREEEVLSQLPTLEPDVEINELLDELAGSLQQFQSVLAEMSEADLSGADSSTLGRLKGLKEKRDRNATLLQEILLSYDEKMAALQVEKKALNRYRPAESKEPRLLDREG